MKKIAILFLCVILLLNGCYRKGSVGASKFFDVAAVVQVCVPYCGVPDYAFDSINLLETDNYGRRLFCYESWQWETTALLICQKTDESNAYYYSDYCYIIRSGTNVTFSEDNIALLKSINDWDLPLNTDKMKSVNYTEANREIDQPNAKRAILLALGKEETDTHIMLDGLEFDQNGNQIILVQVQDLSQSVSNKDVYLVLYQSDDTGKVIALQKIDSGIDCREEIVEFKDTFCAF